jgi:hypothetical protein
MRKFLLLCAFFGLLFAVVGAHADATCSDAVCIDVTGKVIDPHGNGVPNINVWAQGAGSQRVNTTTNAAGAYELHLPQQTGTNNCWLIGGSPDMFYAIGNAGTHCTDGTVNIPALYRTVAQAPAGREFFYPSTTQSVPMDLEVWANSHTYPAPFENDPMRWTITDHPLGESVKRVAQDGAFSTRTVTKIGDVYHYVWRHHIIIEPHGASMVHVDWGLNSTFHSMMDCRMLWFGFGMQKISPSNALPGQVVTIEGVGFGTKLGRVYMTTDRGTRSSYVDPSNILSWTPTKVEFIVPVNGSSGFFRLYNASGIGPRCLGGSYGTPSPRQWWYVDAQRAVNDLA